MPGFPVHHQLPELSQTRVHRVSDAIQPPHPLSSPSPSAFSLSQHAPGCHAAKRKPLSLPGMVSDRNGRGRVFHREPWGEKAQQRQGTLLLLLLGAGRRLEARPALQESDKIKKTPQNLRTWQECPGLQPRPSYLAVPVGRGLWNPPVSTCPFYRYGKQDQASTILSDQHLIPEAAAEDLSTQTHAQQADK